MIRASRLPLSLALTLAAAACGDLQLASSAVAAAAPPVTAPPPSAPASPEARLQQLDQLHADLELAKLRAAVAKANAEARDAQAAPALGAAGAPPLPQMGPASPYMNLPPNLPPIVSQSPDAGKGKAKGKDKADAPEVQPFTLVEAWGSGAERQAIIHSEAGDRLVHVGDQLPIGVVTAINGGAVTYRDDHGRTRSIF
jgi:hypothetical protein